MHDVLILLHRQVFPKTSTAIEASSTLKQGAAEIMAEQAAAKRAGLATAAAATNTATAPATAGPAYPSSSTNEGGQ